jgi:hypothetical protein
MQVHISIRGEPSVGIPHFETTMELGIDIGTEPERDFIRECLTQCFIQIYETNVGVEFEDEKEYYFNQETDMILEQN